MTTCPNCEHEAEEHEFYDQDNDAPDLANILYCPSCDHSWEGSED